MTSPAELALAVARGAGGVRRARRARGRGVGCRARGAPRAIAAARPECGAPDTWENRQGASFRTLVAEIDGCPSLAELARLGKRLYALALPHDQAGVAWSRYALRRTALEAAVVLGAAARALVSEVERASERELPRVGAKLYRLQRGGATAIAAIEWRRIWAAYRARRHPRAA